MHAPVTRDRPLDAQNAPREHAVGTERPVDGQKLPIAHKTCVDDDAPAGQYAPAAHAPDTELRPALAQNEPGGQSAGVLMAVAGQNEPIGHVTCAPTVAGQ